MPLRTSIDDTNTTLIQYTGEWQAIVGSTRQWDGGVHATSQVGASATFNFRGYQLWVWGTTPAGAGTNSVEFSIDGSTPNITSRTSNASAIYNDLYYLSPLLQDTYHTIVVTNEGTDLFLLDRFEFEGSDDIPLFTPTGVSSSTAASTASTSTVPSSSHGSKTPIGVILGPVIGVLALIVAISVVLLRRRRNTWRTSKGTHEGGEKPPGSTPFSGRSILTPTPFRLDENKAEASSAASTDPLTSTQPPNDPNNVSAKAGYRQQFATTDNSLSPGTEPFNSQDEDFTSLASLNPSSSHHQLHVMAPASTWSPGSNQSPANDASSSILPPQSGGIDECPPPY